MADVRVNLAFTADTSKAQAAIQSLQQSLSQLSSSSIKGSMSKEMEQASEAAKELQYHLNQAFNAKTGNFDLSRLDKSLKSSGQNIDVLSSKLLGAGQQGQQAFIQLAQSIAAAERPSITLSKRMTDLFTTLKNTAKWQISSSILHGFMGAVQQAYGYAQDLNESLNNIRIVTGYSVDKMAQFAGEANKAAKALSTTTTAYTDASLIYYQQGLSDSEVKERTDVTVKLANVARESATEVSDQMTAVWNNFADGSKSLEYYADVITKLGAATAASNAEIAEGIEKFSAISNTVGLSFEYATSALTTVVDRTRQSADVVGTAFKTMFARIQGLKLGKTLEDGTTLNQYSQALQSVGINIKESNGELKNMDVILDEMGAKWKDLNRDEQVALAQKVAGVRQYQQLVSLMENYDFFKENVELARNSEGALQEQADIYAESWEAASKRVKASAEAIYSDLLNDKFFININNALSGLLDSIDAFIDGFGGIGPLITSVGSILLGVFANKIPGALNNLKANFDIVFTGAIKSADQLSQKMIESMHATASDPGMNWSKKDTQELSNAENLLIAKNRLSAVSGQLTEKESQEANMQLQLIEQQQKELTGIAALIDEKQTYINQLQVEGDEQQATTEGYEAQVQAVEKLYQKALQADEAFLNNKDPMNGKAMREAYEEYNNAAEALDRCKEGLDSYKEVVLDSFTSTVQWNAENRGMGEELDNLQGKTLNLSNQFNSYKDSLTQLLNLDGKKAFGEIQGQVGELMKEFEAMTGGTLPEVSKAFRVAFETPNAKGLEGLKSNVQNLIKALEEAKIPANKLKEVMIKLGMGDYATKTINGYKALGAEQDKLAKKQGLLNSLMSKFQPNHVVTGVEALTKAASGLGSTVSVINSVKSAINALNNEDLSIGEKITTIFMSISMGAGATISALKNFAGVITYFQGIANVIGTVENAQNLLNATTLAGELIEKGKISTEESAIVVSQAKTLAYIKEGIAERGMTESVAAGILVKKLGITQDQAATVAKELKAEASLKEALAEAGLTTAIGASTIVKIADTAATWLMNAAMAAFGITLSSTVALVLVFVAALAGIALIIGGVVLGIKALVAESNKYSDATKKAEEQVKNFEGQLQNAKQAAEDLKATISNWDSAVQALSELDKHTEAYAEKLKEANQQAQDLIEKYGLYNDYFIEDGQIKFKEGVLEKIQSETDKRVRALEIDVAAAKIDKNNKSTLEMSNDLSKKMTYQVATGTGRRQGQEYTTYQTKNVGLGQVQMAADKITDFIKAYNTDPNTGKDLGTSMIPSLEEIKQYLKTNEDIPSAIRDNLDSWGDDLITELVEYSQEKDKNDKNSAFQVDQIRNNVVQDQYDAQLSQMAVDDTGEVDYARKNTLTELLSIMQKNFDQQNQYDLQRQLEGASQSDARSNKDVGAENDEDLARMYAVKILGVSEEIAEKASYKGGVGKGSLSFKGEEILTNKNDVEMRQELDIQEQKQKVIEDYQNNELSDDLLESLKHISEVGTEYGKKIGADLNSALLESFESGSQKIDLSSIFGELTESEVQELMSSIYSQSPEDFIKQMGISEEELKSLGYDSALDFAQAFAQGLSEWNPDDAAASFKAKLQTATATEAENYDLDPEMVSEVAEAFVEAGKAGDEMYKTLVDNADEAAQVARTYIRVNNAVLDLSEHYEDYAGILKQVQDAHNKQDKAMIANSTSAKKFKTSLAGLLDVSEDFIDADLLDAIDPKDFDAASKGDAKAIENIRSELIKLQADAEGINFEGLKKDIDDLANEDVEVVFGADTTPFLYALLQAKVEAGAGADEINGLLSAFNLTADVSDFEASLTEAEAASARAAGAIINEQTYSTDVEAAQVDTDTQAVDYSVDQTVTKTDVPGQVSTWVISEADGAATPLQYPTTYPQYNKVTSVTPVTSTGTETSAATSQKTTNAAGDQPKNYKGVKIDNIRQKGGNTVSQGTKDTAGKNRAPKGSCFIAGTKVSLGQSFKNIEDIQIGDIVLSYNEQTHKNEYSKVLQTMIHYVNEEIYDLYIEDEVLSVTGIHRFYIKQNDFIQWIAAENLQVGDNVLLANGTWHEIKDIKVSVQLTTVYNFEVANNHNYYVGKNQILAHNKGGGGSGGGKSTPAEKKSLTKKSDVVDRYKRIEDRLKVVNKNLDKYNALSDLAYGKEKVKMMDKIIQNYDREIKLQQRLIEEAKQYAALDKQGLNAAAADLNVKLQYDKDGNIKNIEQVQEKIWQKLNALEKEYNNQPTKEAQDEYQKSHIEPFNEKKEEFDKMLGLYESSLDKMNEATQTKLELEIERMSKKLELANYKIKLKIEVRLDDLERFERELEKLSDTAFTGAKKLAYFTAEITALRSIISNSRSGINNSLKNGLYTTRKTEKGSKEKVTLDDVMTERKLTKDQRKKTYQQILNQEAPTELGYKSWEAFEKDWKFSKDLVNDLKEFRNTLLDADDALDEVKEAVDHSLLETFEHWQKVMERNINLAEHYANTSETWLDIIEQIAGRAGMSSGQLKDLRQKDFDTQVNLNKDIWQNYQMASQQYEVSKPAYQKMYDAEIAHENQANARVAELDKLIGNYAGKDYNNKKNNDKSFSKNTGLRATIAKIEDKLENPEKYYKNKNYFSTKEGKKEKERLEERLKKTKQQVKAYKEEREQYQLLAKESHTAAKQAVDDQAEMLEKVNELKEQGIEGLAALIQAADELLDKELADIMKDFERSISGVYGSIDNMSNAFDQNRQIDERYLRDTEKIYQLNKLNRDLEKSMDETSNVKAKQKLAEFQEKIYKYSAEGVKMSKYDLEVMQKQYDLEVAKIALEEAQNAKTQVRLTRDAEGNYSYTYTADENKTAEAEQTYEDKLNDLIQYNNDYQIETQSAILDAQKSWEDALQDLLSRRKEFTEEEYMAKLQEVNAFYTSQMHYFAGENEKASQHSMEAFVLEYDSYYDNTQKKIGVTKMFTDEEKANYEKMQEVYENAAIKRDKELYAEEWKYKEQAELINQIYQGKLDKINEFYDKEFDALEKSYQAGAVTQEYYLARREQLENEKNDRIKEIDAEKNTDLENAARGHIDVIQGITDQYHEDLKADIELENGEHKAASDYWQDLMEKDYIANGEYLGKIKDGNTGFITSTQTEFLPGLQDSYTTATESVEGFTNAVTDGAGDKTNNTLMGQINNAVDQNNKNVAAAMGSIGISTSETGETAFEDLADTAATELGEINSASSDLADEIEADAASGVEDMGIAADGVEDWYNKCYPKWHQAKEDIDAITTALNGLISTAAGADPINVNVKTNFNYPEETEPKQPKKKKTNTTADPPANNPLANNPPAEEPQKQKKTSTQGDGKLQVGDKVTLLSQGYEDSWGNGRKISKDYVGQTVKINKYSNKDKVIGGTASVTGDYYISLSTLKGGDLGWVKKKQISGYDTGGYTGKWGADGRLALLHQKELVLNEEDTKNVLSTVSIVRELAAMIDLQAQQARLSSQYALSTGQISSMQNAALDQNVHITAEFPNVQDHNEIEMAITSLVNRASQYAWRN